VVVRELPAERTGVVVVGVDRRSSSAAVEYALAHAERLGAAVRAVFCTEADRLTGTGFDLELPGRVREDGYREELDNELGEARHRHPSVPVEPVIRHGRAAEELADEADEADLLVVGSRGRGGFASLVLGSVALTVLHEVRRPVAVVPTAS
jgi:nucleotide-binding universal stress UspA family protein